MKMIKYLSLNAKVMNMLYNDLNVYESSRIKGCTSAKKIWNKLCKIRYASQDIRE